MALGSDARERMLLVAAVGLLVAAALALPGSAAAAGEIAFDGCLANDASQGCVDLPAAPLEAAGGVAVSPDGRSVYVASQLSDSISHFSRNVDTGELAWEGCLADTGAQGCVDLPFNPLDSAISVAVSPDGESVYVTSLFGNSIAHLFRDTVTGELAWDGCLNHDGSQNCGDLPGTPLNGAVGIAVSPDGKSVYVASQFGDSIAHFVRGGPDGQITYDGCLANTNLGGCGVLPGAPLDGAAGVALSADGTSVYVASRDSDSVAHFSRNTETGQILYQSCLANTDATDGCLDVPGAPLTDAVRVAVSPDDTSVYVVSNESDSISHLVREPVGGGLTWDGCLDNSGLQGCVDLPGTPLDGAFDVAVSRDAGSVYVASIGSDSISRLVRDTASGDLSWDACLANTGDQGCGDLPAAPLDAARGVAVGPDSKSVYVTSGASHSIAHFREPVTLQPPGGTPPPGTPPPAGVDVLAPAISRLSLTNRRFRVGSRPTALVARRVPVGTRFRYTLSEPATVSVALQRRHGGRWRRAGKALTRAGKAGRNRLLFSGRVARRALRAGRHRARFTAIDAAGNRSRSAGVRFRIVGARG